MTNSVILSNYADIGDIYTMRAVERLKERTSLSGGAIRYPELEKNKDILIKADFAFTSWGMYPMSGVQISEYLPNLKCLFHAGDSTAGFAGEFLSSGVRVFNAPYALAKPVAEYTAALIVMANKGFFRFVNYPDKRPDLYWGCHEKCRGNLNAKIGIFGFGAIGRYVAKILCDYRMIVYVCDDGISAEEAAEYGAVLKDKRFLMGECDVITNHLTHGKARENYFDYGMFALMKDDGVFINTNIGVPQVEEKGLVRALTEKPDRRAFFDVTWPEPLPADSGLLRLKNFYTTPHLGGNSGLEKEKLALEAIETFFRYLDNRNDVSEVGISYIP